MHKTIKDISKRTHHPFHQALNPHFTTNPPLSRAKTPQANNHPSNPSSALHSSTPTGSLPSFLLVSMCFPICSNRVSSPCAPLSKPSPQKTQRHSGGGRECEGRWQRAARWLREIGADAEGLGQGRLRVLVSFLLVLDEVVVVLVASSGMLSGCMRRTCWMKRSLRLKSL
jgi:hypothetical protein